MNTRAELYQYIESLDKQPGTYSLDELYEIGVLHKSLPQNQKSWKALIDKVGYRGTVDSYRSFVNREQNRKGDLKMEDKEEILNDNENFEMLYREKTQIRDIYNAYRKSLRDEARSSRFKDVLIQSVEKLPKLDFSKREKSKATTADTEAVLLFSDLHLGVNCKNFYNTYNHAAATRRVKKLLDDTVNYCNLFNVKRLNVLNLGDLIHGIIHVTARIEAEYDVADQVMLAAELLANFLVQLDAQTDANIYYRSCTDNHSRMVANKDENLECENYSRLVDWYLSARLKGSKIKMINDNIDESLGKFDLLNGKAVMFAHGHLENTNKCVDAFAGATKQFIDYIFLSHFHSAKEKSYNGSKVFVNGSIVGTEQYALSKRLFSPAEQKLVIFEADNVLDLNINLQI